MRVPALRTGPPLLALPILAALSALCVALLPLRVVVLRHERHGYMLWNLFLAWLPVLLGLAVARLRRRPPAAVAVGAVWLLFLPNAPYMVTDLIHARNDSASAFVFDLVLLGAFAALGLLLGAAALRPVHGVVERRFGRRPGLVFVALTALLTAVGVYLGRVQRWNSWAVLGDPVGLVAALGRGVARPQDHPFALVGIVVFAVLFAGAYALVTTGARPTARHLRPTSRSGPGELR